MVVIDSAVYKQFPEIRGSATNAQTGLENTCLRSAKYLHTWQFFA